ncbi:flagellar basal body-associated FliL family protein [Egicoccus halophilus]|uniref:Flagellar protein FliL n=1 Tax=Egicoccus halophilus TaxID=1670830 RepID=A0A8J3A812_9ACTN|nr:flagellar basal body-associated FliL family protein [Egicoccus halophilus]GGI06027.1 hypothetical protein GCM10011354_17050 [Egicoccus halophilus]
MTTQTVPSNRRLRGVVAVSIVVSLLCIGWWGVRLQWFAAEPDVSEHVVTFEPQTVTLRDGAHARIGLAVVVVGTDGIGPVEAGDELVRAALVDRGLALDAATLRSGDGQLQLRSDLLDAVRGIAPDTRLDRVLLTEVLVQ